MTAFAGATCVVTGAASGIGAATARMLAKAGAHVVIGDRADASGLAAELGGRYVPVDVTDESSVEALMTEAARPTGRIDVVVNNAGVISEAPIDELTGPAFQLPMQVHALGVLYGIKHGARRMTSGGAIVNTASLAGKAGMPAYGAYSASKAAVISLTRTAAIEYGPQGIRVNCVCPSSVETPMLAAQESGDAERRLSRTASPLGIVLSPEQVAEVILFLASAQAAALTGQALDVDGGVTTGYSVALLEALIG